jgi:hypothetical protein
MSARGATVSAFVRRAGLIWIGAALAAAVLTSCASDPAMTGAGAAPAGNWRISRVADRIAGAPTSSAGLQTYHVSYAAILFPPPAQMLLLCFKDQPAVLFRFPFRVGSTRNGEFSYRFDQKPGRVAIARFVDDHTSVVIEDDEEVTRFIGELAKGNVLYIRTRAFTAPSSSAEFHVDGAPAAIDAAYAGCPLHQPATPRAS